MLVNEAIARVQEVKIRSAWSKGVKEYAMDLLNDASWITDKMRSKSSMKTIFLNGAENWQEFSYGAMSLIYDEDIAKRLCTPSELRKTKNGMKAPNKREQWLDVQARALYQAYDLIIRTCY